MAAASNSTDATERAADALPGVLVWDLPLRVCHWLIVVAFAVSWATGELGGGWFPWHVKSGCAMLVLVGFRIAWGFVGPRHARFVSFLAGPRRVAGYARRLADRAVPTTVGHNPLGGWSVVGMLALLALQAVSGLFANDDVFNSGPLYGYVSDDQSDRLAGFHEANFGWLLGLAGLHVAAVLYYLGWKRIDLVRPMLTGRKLVACASGDEQVRDQRLWLALALIAVLVAVLWYVVRSAPAAALSLY